MKMYEYENTCNTWNELDLSSANGNIFVQMSIQWDQAMRYRDNGQNQKPNYYTFVRIVQHMRT